VVPNGVGAALSPSMVMLTMLSVPKVMRQNGSVPMHSVPSWKP